MSNLWQRVLLTNIAVPVVFFSVFFPLQNHFILFLIYGIIVVYFGSYEISSLIYKKGIKINKNFIPFVNSFIYVYSYINAHNFFNVHNYPFIRILFIFSLILIISFIYARDIFEKDFTFSFEKISYALFGILYIGLPSYFVPLLLNIGFSEKPDIAGYLNIKTEGSLLGAFLVIYLIICIWVNDIFAYVFGMTLGKNKKLGLASSPNKSLAGYIGGYLTTFVFVIVFYILFKEYLKPISPYFIFIFPFFSGFLVPVGDLVESVFKRSAHIKDSGDMIMGRGGVLDSVDTLLYMIPIYFWSLQLYFAIFH